ncbi:MAG TPA: SgcJ/EcaC family oxidoreductase [Longimicrobium sp.]
MSDTFASTDIAAEVAPIVQALQDAWNAGDSAGFAAPFAGDADFVNIVGMHARGRDAIAAGHEHIFRTIYAGSRVEYRLKSARLLRADVALAHVDAKLHVPAGPAAGDMAALWSAVLTRDGGAWKIASFHNTLVQERR